MSNILKLSNRQSDLLRDSHSRPAVDQHLVSGNSSNQMVQWRTDGAPRVTSSAQFHPLAANQSRGHSLEGLVRERSLFAGTPQAEQYINEIYSAGQINRGPSGFSPGSRLHLDMLTGRDDRINFGDYLNFENRYM